MYIFQERESYVVGWDFAWHKAKEYLWSVKRVTGTHLHALAHKLTKKSSQTDIYRWFETYMYVPDKLKNIVIKSIYLKLLWEIDATDIYHPDLGEEKVWYDEYYPRTRIADFSYNSNQIEGSKMPYEEVKLFVEQWFSEYENEQEIMELKNTQLVWEAMQTWFSINERGIKRVYSLLTKWLNMQDGRKYPRWRRKIPMSVWNADVMSPESVSDAMKNLLSWYHEHKSTLFPLQLAFEFHYRYERIHPFRDGNGRTWRLLMNKILLSKWFFPMIIFLENRQWYFNVFEKWEYRKKRYRFMLSQYEKTLDLVFKEL